MVESATACRPWASLCTHCNILPYAKRHAHRRHDSSAADHKRPKSGQRPSSWKSLPLPQNSWNSLVSIWNYPASKSQPPPQPRLLSPEAADCILPIDASLSINLFSLHHCWLLNSFLHEANKSYLVGHSRCLLRCGTWPSSRIGFSCNKYTKI